MVSLERCREILGDEARGLSDAELEVLRRWARDLARLLVQIYLDNKAKGVTFPSDEPPTAKPG
jgi:hypothetical protein